jgi:thiol:disulfide interchange protein DsbD
LKHLAALFFLCLLAAPAQAQLKLGASADELLEPEKAFRFSARAVEGAVEVEFAIAKGYYLYREKFRFGVEGNPAVQLGAPELPRGARHKDEFFGEVETYRQNVRIRIPAQGEGRFDLKVVSQGCADAGVCYVPMESKASLRLAGAGGAAADPGPSLSIFASDFEIQRLFEGSFAFVMAMFFGFGLLLTFTPCVLPMIPILSGIIAGEGAGLSKSRAFALSGTYVLSMALTYALAGVGAAYAGSLLAAYLQNPWVLGAFALIFVGLALSMFGLFELRLPGFVHQRLDAAQRGLRGGRIASVAVMGVLSAVIVSPCVSAPLAAALLEISRTGDVMLGGSALFVMALGMGVPLIVVGVSEGALLPKAGAWMVAVRKFFGVLLLGVAIWVVSPVLPAYATMLGWGLLLLVAAAFLFSWRLVRGAAALAAALLIVGALAQIGGRSAAPAEPAAQGSPVQSHVQWTRVASLAELEGKLRTPGKRVMLDFYADWCVSCKEMEALTFSDPKVRAELDRMLLLQVDVTANNQDDKALLKRFSLFGPPGIIFFDPDGREIKGLRVIGYQPPARFLKTLSLATAP